MDSNKNQEKLQQIGLTKDQSSVYLYLIHNGQMPANLLSKRLGISRTLMYKILEDLSNRSLVTKDESFKVTRFSAAHPYSLRAIAEEEKKQADERARQIETTIGPLVAEYNLQSQKPAIHFMEGLDGVSTILEDTLTSPEAIYMYVDTDTLEQELLDIDAQYVKKRLKKEIPKRMLMARTAAAEAYAKDNQSELTQTKLIASQDVPHFYSFMYIYDGKVSYVTYENKTFTSAIIYDRSLYTMLRFAFEALWKVS
jgi:sugar-specific transcriptional regulator TrmB